MECPKCTGSGMEDTPAYARREGYFIKCPHCRGAGEIIEGDWWMCDFIPLSGKLQKKVVRWKNHLEKNGLKPLHRMEKVR